MRRASLIAALLSVALVLPVSAHHAPVEDTDTDYDAQVSFIEEYVTYRTEVFELIALRNAATSGPERAGANLAVENAISVTLDHLRSLDVRDCFDPVARVAISEFETAVAYFRSIRESENGIGDSSLAVKASALGGLMFNVHFAALFECSKD